MNEEKHGESEHEESSECRANGPPATQQKQSLYAKYVAKYCRPQKQEHSHDIPLKDRLLIEATLGAVLIAGMTCWILQKQAGVMADTLSEIRGGSQQTERLLRLYRGQVIAADKFASSAGQIDSGITGAVGQLQSAAGSASKSINVTQQAIRLDQRAWVAVEKITVNSPTLEANKEFEVELTHKNTGKTPAKNVILITRWDSVFKGMKLNYATEATERSNLTANGRTMSRALIAPNAEYFQHVKPFQDFLDAISANPNMPEPRPAKADDQ